MPSLSLADELAMVRAQISGLRGREQALRMALIDAPDAARCGRWARVEVAMRVVRLFDHRLLPDGVRDDPCFWRERVATEVQCLPTEPRGLVNRVPPPMLRPGGVPRGDGGAPIRM